jgi:hypothetical protein
MEICKTCGGTGKKPTSRICGFCHGCDWVWIKGKGIVKCPKCQGQKIITIREDCPDCAGLYSAQPAVA